jgi:hypothetical protein
MRTIKIYNNGTLIDNSWSESLGKSIIDSNLRQGDLLKSYPFNYRDDENTTYSEDAKEHQCVVLTIQDINYLFIDSYNGSIKTEISIELLSK